MQGEDDRAETTLSQKAEVGLQEVWRRENAVAKGPKRAVIIPPASPDQASSILDGFGTIVCLELQALLSK